jgi:hypothetical protein
VTLPTRAICFEATGGNNSSGPACPWEGKSPGRGNQDEVVEMTNSKSRGSPQSITGRDGYLVLQALAYTILTIEALPDRWQEWSNKEQMKKLLHLWTRGHPEGFLENARHHIGGNCSVFPVYIEHNAAEAVQPD